jgi:hypothetical protein
LSLMPVLVSIAIRMVLEGRERTGGEDHQFIHLQPTSIWWWQDSPEISVEVGNDLDDHDVTRNPTPIPDINMAECLLRDRVSRLHSVSVPSFRTGRTGILV